jgi:hypothetical protein
MAGLCDRCCHLLDTLLSNGYCTTTTVLPEVQLRSAQYVYFGQRKCSFEGKKKSYILCLGNIVTNITLHIASSGRTWKKIVGPDWSKPIPPLY